MDPEWVAAARADMQRVLAETSTGRNSFEGFSTQRVYALFAKTRYFDGPGTHPLVLGVLDHVLGPLPVQRSGRDPDRAGREGPGAPPRRRRLPAAAHRHGRRRQHDVAPRRLHRGERRDAVRARQPPLGGGSHRHGGGDDGGRDAGGLGADLRRQPRPRRGREPHRPAAPGRHPRVRRVAGSGRRRTTCSPCRRRSSASCPSGCRSCSATTSTRRSSATSTAGTPGGCCSRDRGIGELQVEAGGLSFGALAAGPESGPLALCLHGFPDTAHTYRHLLPELAAAGFRAVAPFSRGYAPTDVPADGRYQTGALARDANALHEALGGDERAVIVGHDWGAQADLRRRRQRPGPLAEGRGHGGPRRPRAGRLVLHLRPDQAVVLHVLLPEPAGRRAGRRRRPGLHRPAVGGLVARLRRDRGPRPASAPRSGRRRTWPRRWATTAPCSTPRSSRRSWPPSSRPSAVSRRSRRCTCTAPRTAAWVPTSSVRCAAPSARLGGRRRRGRGALPAPRAARRGERPRAGLPDLVAGPAQTGLSSSLRRRRFGFATGPERPIGVARTTGLARSCTAGGVRACVRLLRAGARPGQQDVRAGGVVLVVDGVRRAQLTGRGGRERLPRGAGASGRAAAARRGPSRWSAAGRRRRSGRGPAPAPRSWCQPSSSPENQMPRWWISTGWGSPAKRLTAGFPLTRRTVGGGTALPGRRACARGRAGRVRPTTHSGACRNPDGRRLRRPCTVASTDAGWSSSVARWAHNPEVTGSNPVPATTWNGPHSRTVRAVSHPPTSAPLRRQRPLRAPRRGERARQLEEEQWLDEASPRRGLAVPPRGPSGAPADRRTSSPCSRAPSARWRPPSSAAR